MRRSKKKGKAKQNKKFIWLALAVLVVGIGFAALQKYLNINGTASIDSSWDVRINKVLVMEKLGSAYEKEKVTYTDTTVTFDVGFVAPDDSITYDIEVVNWGNLNAKLDNMAFEQSGSENITFELTGIKKGDIISAGSSVHLRVKATYSGTTSEELSKRLTATLLFVQTNQNTEEQESELAEFQNSKSELVNDYWLSDITDNSADIHFSIGDGDGTVRYNSDLLNANNGNILLSDIAGKGYKLNFYRDYNLNTIDYMIVNGTKVYNQGSDAKSFYLMPLVYDGATYIGNRISEGEYEIAALSPSYQNSTLNLIMAAGYKNGFLNGTNVSTVVIPSGFDLSKLTAGSLYNYNGSGPNTAVTRVINQTGESINWGPILGAYELVNYHDIEYEPGIIGGSCDSQPLNCSFETGTCGNTQIVSE